MVTDRAKSHIIYFTHEYNHIVPFTTGLPTPSHVLTRIQLHFSGLRDAERN